MLPSTTPAHLEFISRWNQVPRPYSQGTHTMWNDPHVSSFLLLSHLCQEHDAASRELETMHRSVVNWRKRGIFKSNMSVLDLGCGPGLFAEELAFAGASVMGIDLSKRSIEWAVESARKRGFVIDYRLADLFECDFGGPYDMVLQAYGEVNTFSDVQRKQFFHKANEALHLDGWIVFDVSTSRHHEKKCLKNAWHYLEGGFWSPVPHLLLESGARFTGNHVWMNQYLVLSVSEMRAFRFWYRDLEIPELKADLEEAGFEIVSVLGSLDGAPLDTDPEWLAIFARKRTSLA